MKKLSEIIEQGKLENGIYFLPDIQLDRKEYLYLAKHLEFLGGKWNGGKKGFVFDRGIKSTDELLGDNIKKKKKLQLFETPEKLADRLVELAELDNYQTILEPSAGRGRIIRAIEKVCNVSVDYCEIDETNRKYLIGNKVSDDFFELKSNKRYTRIIANPPFSKNQDIDHIMKMYELLDNGILVSLASTHWQTSKNKRETKFREFLQEKNAEITELKLGEFKESGTMVKAVIIKFDK